VSTNDEQLVHVPEIVLPEMVAVHAPPPSVNVFPTIEPPLEIALLGLLQS
jgi:hypothetical protein